MPSQYSDNFVADMKPVLADHYRQWLPYCREAVFRTVEELAHSQGTRVMLGLQRDDYDREALETAWVRPFCDYLERSGKLLRPYLVCLCLEGYGSNPKSRPHQVALAEIIHSSSLMLDDIVDDSFFRRGGPSAHQSYGVRVAGASASAWLNLGFELVWRDQELLGPHTTSQLIQEMAWEHFVTGLGTTIDVTWAWLRNRVPQSEEYLQQVVHRSTSYTYRLPMKIGGLTAQAPDAELRHLAAFGEQVGLAFQLVDDVLNLKPRDRHWGKEVAEDVSQGKYSLLVILALRHANPQERDRLLEILGCQTHDQALLQEAVSLIEETSAFDKCLDLAYRFAAEAGEHIDRLSLPGVYKERLRAFVEYVVRRGR